MNAIITRVTTYKILFTIIIKMNLMMLNIRGNNIIANDRIMMIVIILFIFNF